MFSCSLARFQCSSASRKFLNPGATRRACEAPCVSVLFSEPKIPQCRRSLRRSALSSCFSALQRAENSSMRPSRAGCGRRTTGFSALQRAENSSMNPQKAPKSGILGFSALQRAENSSISGSARIENVYPRFSALQRAENSSMENPANFPLDNPRFQCSSASRKFLNSTE